VTLAHKLVVSAGVPLCIAWLGGCGQDGNRFKFSAHLFICRGLRSPEHARYCIVPPVPPVALCLRSSPCPPEYCRREFFSPDLRMLCLGTWVFPCFVYLSYILLPLGNEMMLSSHGRLHVGSSPSVIVPFCGPVHQMCPLVSPGSSMPSPLHFPPSVVLT